MPMATIRKTRERIENTEGYEDVLITLSTWNTLLPAEQPSVMSIRDADGRFFTPGFFTGVHGHRSITQVIGAAKLHSARTRRPGFSVSEADVTITLPAGSTLTQLMDSDDPLQQQVVNIKRLQVGAQAELLSLVGREADRKVSLSETIRSDPGAFFTAFFAYPGYRNVKIVYWELPGPALGIGMPSSSLASLATVRPECISGLRQLYPTRNLFEGLTTEEQMQKRIHTIVHCG